MYDHYKTKIKPYGDEAIDDKKVPKVGSNQNCLAVMSSDSALKKNKNYYPQVFLKNCKYIEKEKNVIRYITDDLETFPDDCDAE